MIEKCRVNLNSFGLKNYTLFNRNFLEVNTKRNFLVFDLPYGLNTNGQMLKNLYRDVISHISIILKKKAVIVFPIKNGKRIIPYKQSLKKKVRVIKKFEIYIHKSLSREIFVVEPASK